MIEESHCDDNRVPFVALTLEKIIDAIRECGAAEVADILWARYADFDRVMQVVMGEIDALAPDQAAQSVKSTEPPALTASCAVSAGPQASRLPARGQPVVKTKAKAGAV